MRLARLLPLLGLAALAMPVHAAAGTTTGEELVLSPAEGEPGCHFTATFSFSVAVCNQYSVDFRWDNTVADLGSQLGSGTGQACQVSIQARVPASGADPGSHTVTANSHPRSVAAGDGPGPSGAAAFQVLQPQAVTTTTTSSAQSAQSTAHSTTTSSASLAGNTSTSPAAEQSTSASASATDEAPGSASASTTAVPAPQRPLSGGPAPPATTAPLRTAGPGWLLAGAVILLGLLGLGLRLAQRAGRLRIAPWGR